MHRGYFAKRYPQTSRRPQYFLPSAFIAFFVLGPFVLPADFFLALTWMYLLFILAGSLHARRPALIAATLSGIFLSHLTYGFNFIRGLLAGRLKEET